jgi:hypothetical protein
MLTAGQMATIATESSIRPLHLSATSKMYKLSPLKLSSVENLMKQQKVYLQLQVRDISLLKTVSSYSQLQNVWATAPSPSKETLQQLSKALTLAGASIKSVSEYWRDVGIGGNLAGLAGMGVCRLDVLASAPIPGSVASHTTILKPELTPDQWGMLATFLLATGCVLAMLTPVGEVAGIAVLVFEESSLVTTISAAQWGAVGAVTISAAGVAASGIGLYQSVVDNPSAAPVLCSPSASTSNFPVDSASADAGVLSMSGTPDAYASYNQPALNLDNLPPAAPPTPPTSGPGPTPIPTSGPGPTPIPTSGPGPTPIPTSGPGPTPIPTSGPGPTPIPTSGPIPTLGPLPTG